MSCRRWLSSFGRDPLTYETLKTRCKIFRNQKTHSPAEIQDYIRANRKLQKTNRELGSGLRFGTLETTLALDLNVSSTQLEQELWRFLQQYWKVSVGSGDVVKTYIATAGKLDMSRSFLLVRENFRHALENRQVAIGPVTALVHVLLRENDFHGCFKLVDSTVKSAAFLHFRKQEFKKEILKACVVSVSFGISAAVAHVVLCGAHLEWVGFVNQVSMSLPIIPFCIMSGLGTVFGLKASRAASPPRVQWRPHTSWMHRILHAEEALLVNKIVTYFEEYSEVNVKNFHLSLLRPETNPNVLNTHDYELQLPESSEASHPEGIGSAMEDLSGHFRYELHSRKMFWRPLKEERMFLDFWVNHGDNYEWVEPDQDPAELVMYRSKSLSSKEALF